MIDYSYAFSNKIVPLHQENGSITILSKYNPSDKIKSELQKLTDKNIKVIQSPVYNFDKYFEEYYSIVETNLDIKREFEDILKSDIDALFTYILKKAQDFLSSDIHIIGEEKSFIIKFRINSILRSFVKIDINRGESLIRIIKLKSNIDISRTLTPLEGRFDFVINSQSIDYRVSIMPTISGEKISIRILGNTRKIYTLRDIGLNCEEEKIIKEKINKNAGFILITGATGSGKSTTLFTMLHYLNDGTKNIISIEDPIEYKIDGVTQIAVSKEKNIEFHNVLRFVLRQDPQIINIGEIRDEETAKLAISSANTGHLVFSTMHTNNSVSSIQRLHDLGLEGFEVMSALSLIISQRLIRVLCPHCKQEYEVKKEILNYYGLEDRHYFKAVGCNECYGSGYITQKAVFEILVVDDNVRKLIKNGEINEDNINIRTLKQKLLDEFAKGETSIEEISKYI